MFRSELSELVLYIVYFGGLEFSYPWVPGRAHYSLLMDAEDYYENL
jgi:hypothetical protein